MSRPTTRGKGKRQRQGENENDPTKILRKIHASGEVSSDDVNKLYMIWKPACQGCRVNTKDNPNCFCGLVPPPNGARKSGLWQKMSEIIQALGPAPSPEPRASDDWPAGLSNLGATCYANSILQFLYMNRSFRDGVFSVEPDVLKQKPVLDQLARLFAQLYACKMSFVDSAPFIKTLELDNGVQQDSHEFMTLLLSLLERCLSHSRVPKAKKIVQDLFRGSVSHATTCSNCGKNSEASSKIEDFYELELNVKGLKTLDLSLDDYLTVEKLDGENQYFCDSCQQRVDATRCIKLRSLPNILNFQLKRCVFLPKTTAKKKITTAFAFPRQLDMRGRLSEPPQLGWTYDLSAILLHKGTAVNSGHYVAHIKDENSGIWWEFDDEVVTKLGCHPFGEGSSSAGNEGSQSEAGPNASGFVGSRASTNGNHKDSWCTQASESSNKMFSSSDAYMLMYTRRLTGKDENERLLGDNVSHVNLGCQDSSSHDNYCLPSHLSKDIEVMNASYLDASKEYELKKEKVAQDIKERRQEVRSILSEATVQPNEQSFFWVSTDWLRQWSDSITPPTLDNTQIQCIHGKVPASRIGSMKRVSAEAWVKLLSKYDGGPTLSNNDHCMACLIDVARSIVNADSYRDRRMAMKDLASLVLSGKCPDGEYYVSRTWLQQWVRRKNLDAPNESDAGPTDSLRCPHGQLLPEKAPGAKRLLVPVNLWCFFYEDAMSVKPDDILGCKSFSAESDQCAQCNNELSEVATWEDSLRELKLKQRQNHEKLSTGKNIPLSLQCKYFLVPTSWLTSWRNFVNASGKNVSSVMEPESLDAIIDSLKCEKHLRLAERPPDLVWKRGILLQKGLATDSLTIIPENDWDGFCKEWGGDKESGISAMIESIDSSECSLGGICPELPQIVEHLDPQGEVANGADTAQVLLRTTPEICEECIGERESQELMEKLNYCDQDISVTLLRGKEAPKSILDAPPTASEPDRRTSKRSRKSRDGNTVSLKVSGSTTIYHLKMMIWESLGVVKENQILRKGSRIIDQELATLADSSIFPGDRLWVQDSEIHEHRDIADELSDQKVDALRAEEGFRGTLLTAEASSQSV